jgi:Ca2+-binding EF-hand superfamily protein
MLTFRASQMRKTGQIVIGLAVAGLAVGACSSIPSLSGGPSEIDRIFLVAAGNWDRNKDGIVSCDEWKAYATELMDGADPGRKGHMTPEDWLKVTAVDKMFETVDFKYYDKNSDGKVDRAEFVERPNRAFEMADRDKNCQLTGVELTGARQAGQPAVKITPAGSESGQGKNNTGPGPGRQ